MANVFQGHVRPVKYTEVERWSGLHGWKVCASNALPTTNMSEKNKFSTRGSPHRLPRLTSTTHLRHLSYVLHPRVYLDTLEQHPLKSSLVGKCDTSVEGRYKAPVRSAGEGQDVYTRRAGALVLVIEEHSLAREQSEERM